MTLSDSAVLSGGYYPTGSIAFTLTGPNGFTYTQTDTVSGNGTYTASDTLPTTGTVAGTYTWSVTYAATPTTIVHATRAAPRADGGQPGQPDDRHDGQPGQITLPTGPRDRDAQRLGGAVGRLLRDGSI